MIVEPPILTPNHSMRPYPTEQKTLFVQAGMGVGKSVQEREFVKKLAEKYGHDGICIVKISFRKTFTAQVACTIPMFFSWSSCCVFNCFFSNPDSLLDPRRHRS